MASKSVPFPVGGGVTIPPPPPSSGEHALSRAVSIAHEASNRPKPHLSFHRSDTLVSEALPLDSLEFLKISLTS